MTAGSGISIRRCRRWPKAACGFQLWANLPGVEDDRAALPGHEAADIPEVIDDDSTKVRVVVGDFWGRAARSRVAADPRYLDISVPPGKRKTFRSRSTITPSPTSSRARRVRFGVGAVRGADRGRSTAKVKLREQTGNRSLVVFDRRQVTVQAGEEGIRFLLVSGKPIRPVAWYRPIVMNTRAELNQAVSESCATARSSRSNNRERCIGGSCWAQSRNMFRRR
jgi:redox-sensitive bicupin YhaK (pirin superfamily)